MYVCCVYPTMSKSAKQVPNFLKIPETSDLYNSFQWCPLCVKSVLILLPFLTVVLHESGTRKALLGP
jgi:hypothetical protein